MKPEHINTVVLACCALYNYWRRKLLSAYIRSEDLDRENHGAGTIESGLQPNNYLKPLASSLASSRNYSNDAKTVHEDFEKYFNTYGSIEWQDRMI